MKHLVKCNSKLMKKKLRELMLLKQSKKQDLPRIKLLQII
uniref:Uncharacterized protein n=1 Tax=Siphoviridae sp. ctxMM9 TaxID=2827973 RepID=A0A8S5T609_9CAUD|nr:MAG TPA: hypothetical protein [Siphoviridae sp. ctxMM9]